MSLNELKTQFPYYQNVFQPLKTLEFNHLRLKNAAKDRLEFHLTPKL